LLGVAMMDDAVRALRGGELVAFPTETVFGLGADARSDAAVRRVFAAKGRPATNPLIVHVASIAGAQRAAGGWPDHAVALAEAFWPGPLTIVVPTGDGISTLATAGGATVGLRVPDHPVALELLEAFDGPIAAPSANRSEHVSPTLAKHVADDLGEHVAVILDGRCGVGIESTVVDCTAATPAILRPGTITAEQIADVVGSLGTSTTPSPGTADRHYAPATPTFRFTDRDAVVAWLAEREGEKIEVLLTRPSREGEPIRRAAQRTHKVHQMPADPTKFGQYLYATLRKLDRPPCAAILIESVPDGSAWDAVRDRIGRASVPLA
ncbi:MAG: L-threonylcarbamoyladenylate synthase, partial [Planctomycetota bacterium]